MLGNHIDDALPNDQKINKKQMAKRFMKNRCMVLGNRKHYLWKINNV